MIENAKNGLENQENTTKNTDQDNNNVEKVEITDMVGRIVYSKKVERKGNDLLSLDIGMLPQGSYVVSVVGRRNTYAGRFTKL